MHAGLLIGLTQQGRFRSPASRSRLVGCRIFFRTSFNDGSASVAS